MKPEELREDLEISLGREPFSQRRLEILSRLTAIYERERVLRNGEALPLWRDCPCAEPCWRGAADNQKPGRVEAEDGLGGVPLPWVGRLYKPGGVVVVPINLRNASGLHVEYEIAWKQLTVMEAGGRRPHGSPLAYGSMQAAAAVLRSIAGETSLEVEEPSALAKVLDRTARVQSIKCSPNGERSRRLAAMATNCPPRYLRQELAVLSPGVVVALGHEAWDAMESIGEITDESAADDDYSRSRVRVDGLVFDMVWLHHPAYPSGWSRSLPRLLSNLREAPLAHGEPDDKRRKVVTGTHRR